jgi:hypothetical protein
MNEIPSGHQRGRQFAGEGRPYLAGTSRQNPFGNDLERMFLSRATAVGMTPTSRQAWPSIGRPGGVPRRPGAPPYPQEE